MLRHSDVILVEDNESDAEFTIRAFKKTLDVTNVLHFQDGEEMLEYLFAKGPHAGRNIHELPKLILLDLKMPKINGLEVLKQIKADERTRTIPVVLFTSSREENDVAEAYRLCVNSYVVKPLDFEELTSVIAGMGKYWLTINQPA